MPLFRKLDRHPSRDSFSSYDSVQNRNGINEKPPGHFDAGAPGPAPPYPGTVEAPNNSINNYPNGLDPTTTGAQPQGTFTPQSSGQPIHQDPYTQPPPQQTSYESYPPQHQDHITQQDHLAHQQPMHSKEQYAPSPVPPGTAGSNPFNDRYQDNPNGTYPNRPVVAIEALTAVPATVHCPYCNTTAVTRTRRKVGNITHAIGLVLCITVCLGCIPYFVNGIKDVDHYCGNCNRRVAKWHRSGWAEAC